MIENKKIKTQYLKEVGTNQKCGGNAAFESIFRLQQFTGAAYLEKQHEMSSERYYAYW